MADDRLDRARLESLADSETTPDEGLGGRPVVAMVPIGAALKWVDATVQTIGGDEDGTDEATFADADDAEEGNTIRVLLLSASGGETLRIVRPIDGYWVAP
jgi:hypothetical protein